MTGGYYIVDFKNIEIDMFTGANIPGIYDRIEAAPADKPIMFSNVNDGTYVSSFFAKPSVDTDGIYYVPMNTIYTPASESNDGTPASESVTVLKIESDDDVGIYTVTITSGT